MNGPQKMNIVPDFTPEHVPGDPLDLRGDKVVSAEKFDDMVTSNLDVDDDIVECIDTNVDKDIVFSSENAPDISLQRESCNLAITKQAQEKVCFSYLIPENLCRPFRISPDDTHYHTFKLFSVYKSRI